MSNNSKQTPITFHDEEDQLVDISSSDGDPSAASTSGETSIAKDETKTVNCFRLLLLAALIATALCVSLTAFFMIRNGEQEEFEGTFRSHATKIIETFESEAAEKRTALVHHSRELTSHAKSSNETWPFVTLPDYEMRARLTLELAEVIGIMLLPLVTKENAMEFGKYMNSNQEWYWEGMAIQQFYHGVTANTSGVEHFDSASEMIGDHIYKFTENGPNERLDPIEDSDEGPFFPCWQFSPQIPVPVVGSDFATLPSARAEIQSFVEDPSKRNIIGPGFEFEGGSGGDVFVDLLLERWQSGGNHYYGGPLAYYFIPVFEDFGSDKPLVGLLMAFVYWQTYFQDLLPETARGIHIVVENTCDQFFTFSVSGSNATFMGYGDLHDTDYDHLEEYTDFGAFLQRPVENDGGCYYKLRVFPTKEFEDEYATIQPLVVCLAIMTLFVFTTLVFVLYDNFVEKRQKLVLKTAKQSSDVVSSLFPSTVRQRLYENDNKKQDDSKGGEFLSGNRDASNFNAGSNGSATTDLLGGASPIADEYLDCTVFFADLAGFTKWSSSRTPSEVFQLLETLYGAFDRIAKKLGVFKIETIGDCYVAVTGLPFPQEDHALIMCKFAASCIVKMNQLVNSENLLLTLGDDTSNLEMRVGMHSGSVTAGVLRGEKARFQLFGDTVNTAARMESNGQKGRIQVSQTTADLLVDAGKEKWLTARKDLIEAKGKGKMQTYWVSDVTNSDGSLRGSMLSSSAMNSSTTEQLSALQRDRLGATTVPPMPPPSSLKDYDRLVSC